MGLAVPAARSHSWAHLQSQQTLLHGGEPCLHLSYPVLSTSLQFSVQDFFHQKPLCSVLRSLVYVRLLFGLSFSKIC